jgi:hypothetical protein
MTMAADASEKAVRRLRPRRLTDEEYVEMCRRWLRRDKAMRIIQVFCVAVVATVLVLVGRKFYLMGLSGDSRINASVILGFVLGVLFEGAVCVAITGLLLAIGGHPQKRVRGLMLKFHDELKRSGDRVES